MFPMPAPPNRLPVTAEALRPGTRTVIPAMLPGASLTSCQSKSASKSEPVMPLPIELTVIRPMPAAAVNVESVIPAGVNVQFKTRPAVTVMFPIVEVNRFWSRSNTTPWIEASKMLPITPEPLAVVMVISPIPPAAPAKNLLSRIPAPDASWSAALVTVIAPMRPMLSKLPNPS